ncbi:MAG TPA: haloacid dehalogenase type II [Burkholderiaceae bacterium]|nr:haloacid dehalogenase type II [Burkholderiaceae bacterium]HNG78433.1 haloacid dehalogenase type II [Burkholderiaceae bacterium]
MTDSVRTGTAPARAPVRALLFDVFGTLVDWRGSIAREVAALATHQGWAQGDPRAFGEAFADAWRARYQPAMQEIRSGRQSFCKLDALHRRNLDAVLTAFGLEAHLDEAQRRQLNFAWHRLDAWPDVPAGLQRLRALGLRLAPCSNGNISLMADLARHNGLHWDAVLGAEFARDYKPQPGVYLDSAAAFDCTPAEAVMVAAHSDDLVAAAALGLRTAFIARPDEFGPGRGEAAPQGLEPDWVAGSLLELADQLERSASR